MNTGARLGEASRDARLFAGSKTIPEWWSIQGLFRLVELHGDLFSRHASPLEVYVFVAVANRGEHVMSGEICRRCNGKQQGRRRGGRSVQLPDWFMILHSSSRYLRTYTYYVQYEIYSAKKKKHPPEVRPRDGHVEHVCKSSGSIC